MVNFNDFDVEVQDVKDSIPEHKNGSVTTAGTPVTVARTDTKNAMLVFVNNPSKGVNANAINVVIYVSIDGGTTYVSLVRGESQYFPGVVANGSFKVDASMNGTKYESILWG